MILELELENTLYGILIFFSIEIKLCHFFILLFFRKFLRKNINIKNEHNILGMKFFDIENKLIQFYFSKPIK